jgi:hypothetical protein
VSKPAQSWDRAGTSPFQYIRENGVNGSSKRQIFRARFAPHLVGLEFECNLLTFGEAGQTGALDGAYMNEHIIPAIIGLDEAKTLLAIEPLNSTCRHFCPSKDKSRVTITRFQFNLSMSLGKGPQAHSERHSG